MCHSSEQVRVERDGEGGKDRRGSRADHRGQKGRAQRRELGGLGGEQVVQQEVRHVERDEHGGPAEVHGGEPGIDLGGESPDEAKLLELRGHCNENREPDQGVPSSLLVQQVLPGEDPAQHLQGDADHCRRGARHSDLVPEDPEQHGQQHRSRDHPLDLLHGPHLLDLLGSDLGRVGRVLYLRRIQLVHDVRGERQAREAWHDSCLEPGDPGVCHWVAEVGGQHETQGVLGSPGEGDAREVGRRLELGLRQERAELICGLAGQGPRLLGEGDDDGEVDPAAPRGGAWHGGAEDSLAHRQAVAQPERALAEHLHEVGRHPVPEPGLHEALGEEEGVDNEPDDVKAEGGERGLERERLGGNGGRDPSKGPGAHREGPDDQASDRGDEDGEQLPALGGHSCRDGNGEAHDEPEGNGHQEGDQLDRSELGGRDLAPVSVRRGSRARLDPSPRLAAEFSLAGKGAAETLVLSRVVVPGRPASRTDRAFAGEARPPAEGCPGAHPRRCPLRQAACRQHPW